MPFHFTYDQLTKQGICQAFYKHFGVEMNDGLLQLNNEIASVSVQYLSLPGNIEVVFTDYCYHQEMLFSNVQSNVQNYVLFIDCAEAFVQEYTINNEKIERKKSEQSNAYLMNTVFSYTQLRKAGTTGKSIMIFIPAYLLNQFYGDNDEAGILGRFYSFQNKGASFLQVGIIEQKIIDSFFYQWKKYKNVLSITKYTYQLIEWYFCRLITFLDTNIDSPKLLPEQAQDLFLLQSHIQNNLSKLNLDFSNTQNKFSTPIDKLKELFRCVHKQSVYEYFKELKIIKSMKVLLDTEKNIAEIAYEFGYANPSNFSASFKKYYTLSPYEYRSKNKSTQG